MSDHVLILITCGSEDEARSISQALVERRLAAGVQRFPIDSVYRWQGEVVEDHEVLSIVKTRASLFDPIRELVEDLHSYEVPPILLLPIDNASAPYLDWIDDNVEDS